MRFIVRSNLISFVLDLFFNIGLGFFCLSHFRVPIEARGTALAILAGIWVPRTIVFFAYRIYTMAPMDRWLTNKEQADEATIVAAAKSA
ncbi:MAG: hypothetical protein KC910_36715, partial [Candidatus Eremiobacteraeota bacterium]|nr:hypothetical protein [Candidatus Eremiobacteraeota bacterium]